VLDNDVPFVVSITTNESVPSLRDKYSIGAVIDISVTFSHSVVVRALVWILLKGSHGTPSSAYYWGGNATNVIHFLYRVSKYSGTARLDYIDHRAIVGATHSGHIYRLSESPSIVADTSLDPPGHGHSLGRRCDGIVDVSAPSVTGISLTYPRLNPAPDVDEDQDHRQDSDSPRYDIDWIAGNLSG